MVPLTCANAEARHYDSSSGWSETASDLRKLGAEPPICHERASLQHSYVCEGCTSRTGEGQVYKGIPTRPLTYLLLSGNSFSTTTTTGPLTCAFAFATTSPLSRSCGKKSSGSARLLVVKRNPSWQGCGKTGLFGGLKDPASAPATLVGVRSDVHAGLCRDRASVASGQVQVGSRTDRGQVRAEARGQEDSTRTARGARTGPGEDTRPAPDSAGRDV